MQVFKGLIEGKFNKEIVCDLELLELIVKLYVKMFYCKIDVFNCIQVVMVVCDQGVF